MSDKIFPIITNAGKEKMLSNGGIAIDFTHLGFGDTAWQPDANAGALKSEKQREPVSVRSAGGIVGSLSCIVIAKDGFVVREIGLYSGDILFSVLSAPDYKKTEFFAGEKVVFNYTVDLKEFKDAKVGIKDVSTDVSMSVAPELARMTNLMIDLQLKYTKLLDWSVSKGYKP